MPEMRLDGTWTALVTPFTPGADALDPGALDALVEAQIVGGISGLVPCGTTGEAPTLGDDEQLEVIRRVVKVAAGRGAGGGRPRGRGAQQTLAPPPAPGAAGGAPRGGDGRRGARAGDGRHGVLLD